MIRELEKSDRLTWLPLLETQLLDVPGIELGKCRCFRRKITKNLA
ncbi:MAG: hypothetical protein QNJ70_32040 [Xenococcaceae cyanobacterium MO_207.B15]|nr:hypothetical protein [Xenococcaceae cyanobacterium MO_207.B15]